MLKRFADRAERFTTLFGALAIIWGLIAWLTTVNGYDGRISSVESMSKNNKEQLANQSNLLRRMDYNIQIIGRKIGVKPLEPAQ